MKIDELKVNSYGKIKNKDIKFEDGINIIYGENERGKSTLLNFIVNMFYGTSKNKKGKIMSDFDKYKPWDTEEFSGKIKYTLDNGKNYEVFREFSKKNPKIYDENMEEFILEGTELLARAICHELDHLDGHMYTELVEGDIYDVSYDEEE